MLLKLQSNVCTSYITTRILNRDIKYYEQLDVKKYPRSENI